ncbi:MAG: cytochrome c-type biogenesis protein CcmH [Solirubrobacterales bacterium]|nr:cytochrome c-type biogenesis protein CcmH [Solirubrobacterales bacterium]
MSTRARRRLALVLLAVIALAVGAVPAVAATTQHRASFTQIQDEVMCVVCHEPLAVAQSPEAFQERDYIRQLILQGESRTQIERNLVAQYGPAVLATPPAHGFNVLVYVIPPLVVILGIATLVSVIPRWRRRARDAAPAATSPPLSAADAQRLDDDLARTT